MASMLQSVGSSIGWRSHQVLSDFEESPVPDRFRKKSTFNMDSMRMSLRRRMPLKEVEINFDEKPTWESLEAKEKTPSFRGLSRTAKNVFGTVSQKMQRRHQGPARSLAASLAKPPKGSTRSIIKTQKGSPRTPRWNRPASHSTPTSSTRLVSPASKGAVSTRGKKKVIPLRRSTRAAVLKSPYGSPVSVSVRRQLDCDLELVSTGIRQLKRLSRAFNDIIVQEEREQAILNYYEAMMRNLQAMQLSSGGLAQSLRRRGVRVQWKFNCWTDNHFKEY